MIQGSTILQDYYLDGPTFDMDCYATSHDDSTPTIQHEGEIDG